MLFCFREGSRGSMCGSNHHRLADQGGKLISCVTECSKQRYWKQQTARDFLVFSFKLFLISVDGNIILPCTWHHTSWCHSLFTSIVPSYITFTQSGLKKKKKNLLKISRFLLILTTNPGNLLNFSKFLLLLPGTLAILSSQHSSQSCVRLFATPWTVAHQAPLSVEFSRQEYWSGLPFPSTGDLPDPGIEPRSPALQADS